VFKADAFLPEADVVARMEEEIDRLKSLPPIPPFEAVSYPGEREWNLSQERRKNGIPVSQKLVTEVVDLGARCLT
jgi:LDH2 family malate/lactate/ureidoglycolate dehydrogenase